MLVDFEWCKFIACKNPSVVRWVGAEPEKILQVTGGCYGMCYGIIWDALFGTSSNFWKTGVMKLRINNDLLGLVMIPGNWQHQTTHLISFDLIWISFDLICRVRKWGTISNPSCGTPASGNMNLRTTMTDDCIIMINASERFGMYS